MYHEFNLYRIMKTLDDILPSAQCPHLFLPRPPPLLTNPPSSKTSIAIFYRSGERTCMEIFYLVIHIVCVLVFVVNK